MVGLMKDFARDFADRVDEEGEKEELLGTYLTILT